MTLLTDDPEEALADLRRLQHLQTLEAIRTLPDRPDLLDHQTPPDQPWDFWLLEAGRGAGKTEACARYFNDTMMRNSGWRGRIIAPTLGDAVEACVDGPSGILTINPTVRWRPSLAGGSRLDWPNGSKALVLGTPTPREVERLRASGNRHIDWWEELAANSQLADAWPQADFGLRLGAHPHKIGSTSPRATPAYRRVRGAADHISRATIADNPYTNEAWRRKLVAYYEGTRLGRQELLGELLSTVDGALWSYELVDLGRVDEAPAAVETVVGVDPSKSSAETSDWTGIIVAQKASNGHGYVVDDASTHEGPSGWARAALAAHDRWDANRIVYESNVGGEMIPEVIKAECERTGRPEPVMRPAHSWHSKRARAEPVAALYGDPHHLGESIPRVHHVGSHPKLEDEMTAWAPDTGQASPDRMDALVFAVTDLLLGEEPAWAGKVNVPSGSLSDVI